MTSQLQRRKYEKVFERFDQDGDGQIDQTDIDKIVAKWTHDFHIDPKSQHWHRLATTANRMWQELAAKVDTDHDGKVSKEEWVAAHQYDEFLDETVLPFTVAAFEAGDVNGDGKISLEEWLKAQLATGVPQNEARLAFNAFDADGDGYITKEEYVAHITAFYKGDDQDAPENLMAGRL